MMGCGWTAVPAQESVIFHNDFTTGGTQLWLGSASVWSAGDFNYDGVTNVFDLVSIQSASVYGQGNYFPAAPSAAGGISAVPEPNALAAGLLAAAAAAGAGRLRRRLRLEVT